MDKAEAIKRIKDHIRVHHIGEYPHIKIAEALNLAISALATDTNVGHKAEVVRCATCKHYSAMSPLGGVIYKFPICQKFRCTTKTTDFCSYGERKDND